MNNNSGLVKLIQFLMDGNVKTSRKLLLLFPILYLLSPITLIPYKIFPILGFLENIIVFFLGIYFIKRMLANYQPYSSQNNRDKKKNDKKTVNLKENDYDIE